MIKSMDKCIESITVLQCYYFQKHISGYECLKRGWVLTGYPKTVEDFKLLDLNPTPPNR